MSAKRDHLVKTALKLFYKEGINSTGIDRVLAESGVAKMTLYNHFKSKDELVAATLEMQEREFDDLVTKEVSKAKEPLEKVLKVFDALEIWFSGRSYRGCYFINTAAEFGGGSKAIQNTCKKYKVKVTELVESYLQEANVPRAKELSRQLDLLIEGAIVRSQVLADRAAAADAKAAAKILIEHR